MRKLLALLILPTPALAGDLWLSVDVTGPDPVRIDVPANWLLDADEPVTVHTASGDVDLRDVARELRAQKEGSTRRLDGRDAGGRAFAVAVKHEAVATTGASALELVVAGPKGHGITMSLPIDEARQQVDGALDANGVTVDLSGVELGEQLRRSGPRTLLDVADPDGGRVQVRSR